MIKFRCSHCNHSYEVPDTYANKTSTCTRCGQRIQVPAKSQEEVPSNIKFQCSGCGQKINVSKQYAGKTVCCAGCKQLMQVPTQDAENGQAESDVLRLKPLESSPQTNREIDRDSRPGLHSQAVEYEQGRGAGTAKSMHGIPLALLASFGFTIGAAILWTIIAHFVGIGWVQFLCIPVAISAAYGLALFIEDRGAGLGLIAILIGLFGIFFGKTLLAKWVVMPRMKAAMQLEKAEDTTLLTEEEITKRCKDPHYLLQAASFQVVDSNEFKKDFAQKMPKPSFNFRELMAQSQQFAIQVEAKARKMVDSWTPEQKRTAIIAQFEREKQMSRQIKPMVTSFTRILAFIASFSLLDLIFIPIAIWSAYKIGAG